MKKFDALLKDKIWETSENIKLLNLNDLQKAQLHTNWLKSIEIMERLTKINYLRYNILNLTAIISGALIPMVLNLKMVGENATTFGSVFGVFVTISMSLNQSYRFNDRWKHFRYIAETLKIEGESFFSLSDHYYLFTEHDGEAFKIFMGRVKMLKGKQIDTYIQKIVSEEQKQTKHDDEAAAN